MTLLRSFRLVPTDDRAASRSHRRISARRRGSEYEPQFPRYWRKQHQNCCNGLGTHRARRHRVPSPARSGCIVIGHARLRDSSPRRFGSRRTELRAAGGERGVPLVDEVLEAIRIPMREHRRCAGGTRRPLRRCLGCNGRTRGRGRRCRSLSSGFGCRFGVGSGLSLGSSVGSCRHVGRVRDRVVVYECADRRRAMQTLLGVSGLLRVRVRPTSVPAATGSSIIKVHVL
ncbi:hypothetical protein ATJ93_1262 [Halopiger aswanensis]|uniref:Uncharacterized protein n=1 Tax=Halopiger aswanensis TaxID=148449 RepID=A0A3R7EHZ0_9EURY|nr:hypothetical protein ATJ93_1262 [Halopiger aswanensis]